MDIFKDGQSTSPEWKSVLPDVDHIQKSVLGADVRLRY